MTTSCPKKPNIAEISPHLICALCGGYLIDATTIVECLHSFCKTCIVRYLESSKYCPICEVLVHKTRPLQNIRLDHTLQDIVYKLVPGLFQTEMKRRREFYKDSQTVRSAKTRQEQQRHRIIYSADEKFSICLEFCPDGKLKKRTRSARRSRSSSKETPDRRYFLCPASATVALIKKFIKLKFALPDNFKVDLFHSQGVQGGQGLLRDHFSLMDVAYIHSWRREGILQLYYSIYKEPDPVPQIEITEVKEVIKPDDQEDNRPSSLFTKAKLLGTHSVDASIPHNLSPLELIATVANDISIQEGRGLKRKPEEAQLYEQEEENSDEIQIQKSIEHAIDICSNNFNITESTPSSLASITPLCVQEHSKSISKVSVSATFTDAIQTPVAVHTHIKPALASNAADNTSVHNVHVKSKLKEKPKTTDTASQCDPRPKKHRPDPAASTALPQHSKHPGKPTKLEPNIKISKPDTNIKPCKPDTNIKPTKLDTNIKLTKQEINIKSTKHDTGFKPNKQETAVKPIKLETSVKPTKLETSVKPTKPETTVKLTKQETNAKPNKLETSVKFTKLDANVKSEKSGKTDKLTKQDNTLKQDKVVKPDRPVKTDKPTKLDNVVKSDRQVKSDKQPKVDSPLKVDRQVKSDKPPKVDSPLKVDKQMKSDKPLKVDSPLKVDRQVKSDKPPKVDSPLKVDRQVKSDRSTKLMHTVKEESNHTVDKTKLKEESLVKPEKLKPPNGNNNVDLAAVGTAATKPPEKVIKDNNANQTTIVSGKHLHEQTDKCPLAMPTQKTIIKTETSTSFTQINGFKTTPDATKSQMNHTSVKSKQME